MLDIPELDEAGVKLDQLQREIFARIISQESLEAAYRLVAEAGGGAGGDGVSVLDYGKRLESRIATLSDDLSWGYYQPGPVRRLRATGSERREHDFAILCLSDRIVQTSALRHLAPLLGQPDLDPCRSSGSGTEMALRRLHLLYREGFRHLIDADIVHSFSSVPHASVLDLLATVVPDRRVVSLASRWLDLGGTAGRGLLQGAPISRLFARIYVDSLDERLCGGELRIVRVGNDFLLLARSRVAAEHRFADACEMLLERGITLLVGSSRIVNLNEASAVWGRIILRSFEPPGQPEWERQSSSVAAATATGARTPSRQFRNWDFGTPEAISLPISTDANDSVDSTFTPRSGVLYLGERGRVLDGREFGFVVMEAGREMWRRGAAALERIEIGPEGGVTDLAMRLALASGTPIFFIDEYGGTQGVLSNGPGPRAELHLAQARLTADSSAKLALARLLIEGRIFNRRRKLQVWRLNKRRSARMGVASSHRSTRVADAIESVLPRMKRWQRAALHSNSLEVLAQIESVTEKTFQRLMRLALEQWRVEAQPQRPAAAAVDAVLHWLASLMVRDFHTLVGRHNLHPGFALLRSSDGGDFSLAGDLMEEFRAPVCDGLALTLFNRRQLGPHHFFVSAQDPRRRTWITPEGRKVVMREYETFVSAASVAQLDRKGGPSWRAAFEAQVLALIEHLEGRADYAPHRLDM